MTGPALTSAALLLLLLPPTLANNLLPIDVVVENSLQGLPEQYHTTQIANGGILLGALRRLMKDSKSFRFTYSEHPDFGISLDSVNDQAGNPDDRTYWELLVKTADGTIVRPDVGIGCYIPKAKEQIILKFSTW